MWNYFLRRIFLIPITLFCIVMVNFLVINLAPGDPVSFTEMNQEGNIQMKDNRSLAFSADERYLHFREFYGLTLPIVFNTWSWIPLESVEKTLWQLVHRRWEPSSKEEMSFKSYNALRVKFGDQSRFIMSKLLDLIINPEQPQEMRVLAAHFFVRGASRPAIIGSNLTLEEKAWNEKIANDDQYLRSLIQSPEISIEKLNAIGIELKKWYQQNRQIYQFEWSFKQKLWGLFFETRFMKYMERVLTLNFGTLRNDSNKTVISEVVKRFKYSLTLSITPMLMTFVICQFFGLLMAFRQGTYLDYSFNFLFLFLYAIPIFVVAPFLIEKVAMHHNFPFTSISIPISGFTSPDQIYDNETSLGRLFDILQHIALPIIAIMYGSLASEARLSRTAVLEVLRQDYIRTAKSKGMAPSRLLFKHVGRNAAITIVTSLAGSLGVVLGGSLIVESLFDIDGFGKFFYQAVLNRDYNVIMFSALAGSFLTLVGYLIADLAYMWLDPRITLE